MTTTDTRPSSADAPDAVEEFEQRPSPVGLVALIGLLLWVGFRAGWSLALIIVSLLVMIFMHELGHYLAAKRAGMKVTEFFLGFGPRLWSFKRGETEYGIKALPLGAYVRVIGMNNLEEVDPAEEHRTYRHGRYRDRLLLAVAGSAMHFAMALVLLYVVLVGAGRLDPSAWDVEQVPADGPAAAMGVETGDQIVAIDDIEIETWGDLVEYVGARPNEPVVVTVLRDGSRIELAGTLSAMDDGSGRIGIGRSDFGSEKESALDGIPEAFSELGTGLKDSVVGLGNFFSPSGLANFYDAVVNAGSDDAAADENRVISVVGAARIGADISEEGWENWAAFMIGINIFVGVFNLVPLLPLDGGHVAVATYERARSRKGRRYHADVEKLLPLTYAVLLVLVVVGLAAIYLDIADPITL